VCDQGLKNIHLYIPGEPLSGQQMDKFKKYLYQFRCEKGQPYTHTSIANPQISLHVPLDKANEFNSAYTKAMVSGCSLHLTEKPTDPSPMRADLDYRFSLPESKEIVRCYGKEDVRRILTYYFTTLACYLEAPASAWIAYVMEKPEPTEYRGKVKDGIHIVWPELVVSHTFQHLVRKKLLDEAQKMFSGMPICNTYEDVIDQAIIDKNNWQMYGSHKPDSETYRVTSVFQYDPSSGELTELATPSAEEELRFVSLFSMRHKENSQVCIKEEKANEVDEYVRLVLPTMDERKKSKLHSQIFGKSINHTKNFISDDELTLARQLVAECLSQKRAENYEDWIKVGWTLRNIDYRLLDAWKDFSKCSSKYIEGECNSLWERMRIDTLGMGTLRWWASLDNPIKYNEILDSNAVTLIDRCIGSDGAHFDVARVVHALYKDRYRFTTKDVWYMFKEEKHRWVRTREGLQLRLVLSNEVCSKFLERAAHWNKEAMKFQENRDIIEDKSKKLTSIAFKLKQSGYKDSLMKECKCLFTDEKFEELLDSHPHLIGFENGVYDLRMHEFRDGLPDDYISFSTGRHYVPFDKASIESQEIDAFFASVYTNEEVKRYMKDVLACILDGGIRQEKFYIFTGSGSNGKSKIIELVQTAIGDYFCILPIALLTQKRAASNCAQSELERTKGRRFAVMQEPGENEKLNIGLMKELSGGDRIMCRGLFKEPIEFKPQFKMIMTCNELPEVPSDDGGTWRRIRVIEHTSKFVEHPDPKKKNEFLMDTEIVEKFERWADTFVSMLIDHHRTMDPKNIKEPTEVRIATEGYKKNNDIIGQYVSDKLVADENSSERVLLNKVYTDFKAWAYDAVQKGKKIPDRNQFRAYLEKQFGAYPSDGKGWRGIKYVRIETSDDVE
jgi:P4 family phage/plasmid primase-like protien